MSTDYWCKYMCTYLVPQEREKKGVQDMKQITKTRKAVATMASKLRKLGYILSKAFKTSVL